jgi:hypothetical protein
MGFSALVVTCRETADGETQQRERGATTVVVLGSIHKPELEKGRSNVRKLKRRGERG